MFEKVNPSHPDKLADRIAGALVDLAYKNQANPRVAVEVLLGHGFCHIMAESSFDFDSVETQAIVERIVGPGTGIYFLFFPQDPILANNQAGTVRCGDNGIFCGMPVSHEQRLLTRIAADIYAKYPTDGKYIIKTRGTVSSSWREAIICQSCLPEQEKNSFHSMMHNFEYGLEKVVVNPLGYWTGGPDVDCGATNRKLGSDMGDAVTGGGLHGKDLSKADVSVNIWCHLEAMRTRSKVKACCAIGDETVNGVPYSEIVETARAYIKQIGGFEKFAEWGLIRP